MYMQIMIGSLRQGGFHAILSAVALAFFASDLQASEPEVEVIGCVVDYVGQPYRNVFIELSGLNYKGGAGYTGNNSIGWTDERGEFTVRMKAGLPGMREVPAQPARARIRGKREVYVNSGGLGGVDAGKDVWPDTIVENIGKPVDLRPEGCIRFPYPIEVIGLVTSDELLTRDEQKDGFKLPSLRLRISDDDAYVETGDTIPGHGIVRNINFGVALRPGDKYKINIPKQPYSLGPNPFNPKQKICYQCDVKAGNKGTVGDIDDNLTLQPLGNKDSLWAINKFRVHCTREKTVKSDADCHAADANEDADRIEDKVPPRRGGSIGATMFQQAIKQAKQDEKKPGARESREQEGKVFRAELEKQDSANLAKLYGALGGAVVAAAGGQTPTEQMQLVLNSLAQSSEESGASDATLAIDGSCEDKRKAIPNPGDIDDCGMIVGKQRERVMDKVVQLCGSNSLQSFGRIEVYAESMLFYQVSSKCRQGYFRGTSLPQDMPWKDYKTGAFLGSDLPNRNSPQCQAYLNSFFCPK